MIFDHERDLWDDARTDEELLLRRRELVEEMNRAPKYDPEIDRCIWRIDDTLALRKRVLRVVQSGEK